MIEQKPAQEIQVMKFGGSSLTNPQMMAEVAQYVQHSIQNPPKKAVVVVSAMGKTTDGLIEMSHRLSGYGIAIRNMPKREQDRILTTGEMVSAALLAITLNNLGVPVVSFNAYDLDLRMNLAGDLTDIERIDKILSFLQANQNAAVVVTGFQALDDNGAIATLERGGSDLTAVFLAHALQQDICEIYTDVDGVYQIDPRIAPRAKRMDVMSYSQMLAMASAGAKVMMLRSILIAQALGIEIKVMLSPGFGSTNGGTLITSEKEIQEIQETRQEIRNAGSELNIGSLTPCLAIQDGGLIQIERLPEEIGYLFGEISNIPILDANQSKTKEGKVMASILFSPENFSSALPRITDIACRTLGADYPIQHEENVAGLTLIDPDPAMREKPAYISRLMSALDKADVEILMLSSSGTTILVVVKEANKEKAALAVGKEFEMVWENETI